jgi:hypothetical protein
MKTYGELIYRRSIHSGIKFKKYKYYKYYKYYYKYYKHYDI